MDAVLDQIEEKLDRLRMEVECDLAEAQMLLEWAHDLPVHRLSLEAWTERELTRAARSA